MTTAYAETELLVAALERDEDQVRERIDGMFLGELRELEEALDLIYGNIGPKMRELRAQKETPSATVR